MRELVVTEKNRSRQFPGLFPGSISLLAVGVSAAARDSCGHSPTRRGLPQSAKDLHNKRVIPQACR